jgi:uncharacterized protein (TIGR03083 family)
VPAGASAPIDPRDAFGRAVDSLDEVLGTLEPHDWHRTALRGLDVQGLVGHLIGVERGFAHALEATDDAHALDDHVDTTQPFALRQEGRVPLDTHREWRTAVDANMTRIEQLLSQHDAFDKTIALYGMRLPLGSLLVVRTFELWTHEEDIRRASARPLDNPDAASLRLMTSLAIQLVPAGMARANVAAEGRSARLVLTGPGGGTWETGLGPAAMGLTVEGPVDVRIVAEAVDFCRLVANRIDPSAFAAVVTGDGALAQSLFRGAVALALD